MSSCFCTSVDEWRSSLSEWVMTHMILTLITSVYVISSPLHSIPIGPPLVLGIGRSLDCQKWSLVCCYLLKSVKEALLEPMLLWCSLLPDVDVCLQSTQGHANVFNVLYCSLSCVWESDVSRHPWPVDTHTHINTDTQTKPEPASQRVWDASISLSE